MEVEEISRSKVTASEDSVLPQLAAPTTRNIAAKTASTQKPLAPGNCLETP